MNVRAHGRPPRWRGPAALVAVAALVAGCFADPTEIIIVVDTDAVPFKDFKQIIFSFNQGEQSVASPMTLPATVGAQPQQGGASFDVTVVLSTDSGQGAVFPVVSPSTFATRKASNVRFVANEMRVLFIPIPRICACVDAAGAVSTNCPHALDPECRDMTSPTLSGFDEDHLPRLPR